jgi:hypothetical protein
MELISSKNLGCAILLAVVFASPLVAQDVHVEVGKRSRAIPKSCELVTPANIDGPVDIPSLVKEAICKGAGDMLAEYTYTVNSLKREKDKKGKVKDETFVYEVFIPTLKGGMRTKGVLVVTSHNGVAVPPDELEKSRLRAAEKIEKEEERIERNAPVTSEPDRATGMSPLGMYARTTMSRSAFGVRSGAATLDVSSFLKSCDLAIARREQVAGRDTLIFTFTPRAGTEFTDNEKYIAQLTGEIWIDAVDRIVTRLVGWPANAAYAKNEIAQTLELMRAGSAAAGESLPAVYVEIMRLPQQGIWLPHVVHINGADHQALFDGIKTTSTSIYSNYIRFSTEVQGAEVGEPKKP